MYLKIKKLYHKNRRNHRNHIYHKNLQIQKYQICRKVQDTKNLKNQHLREAAKFYRIRVRFNNYFNTNVKKISNK